MSLRLGGKQKRWNVKVEASVNTCVSRPYNLDQSMRRTVYCVSFPRHSLNHRTHTYQYIPQQSAHPTKVGRAIIFGCMTHYRLESSLRKDCLEQIGLLCTRLGAKVTTLAEWNVNSGNNHILVHTTELSGRRPASISSAPPTLRRSTHSTSFDCDSPRQTPGVVVGF